jgi:hypothetical protein
MISHIDWQSLFLPSLNIGEIFLRGSIVYLFLFFLLRILRRQAGTIGISDLLVIVLIADAAQNAMASQYQSITEGLILVTTIAFWDYFLDWLGYRFPIVAPLIRPTPLLLIKHGHIQKRNLSKELITVFVSGLSSVNVWVANSYSARIVSGTPPGPCRSAARWRSIGS